MHCIPDATAARRGNGTERTDYQLNDFISAPVAPDFNAPISPLPSLPPSLLFAVKRPISAVSRELGREGEVGGKGERENKEGVARRRFEKTLLLP